MAELSPLLDGGHRLTPELMIAASREPADPADKDTGEFSVFKAVETLTKGIEVSLPGGRTFRDKDGYERSRVRASWWGDDAVTYQQSALPRDQDWKELPADAVPAHARLGSQGAKPLFIGHYWLNGQPGLLSKTVACVDYSVAKGGKLVAYRWDGEATLDASRFHWAPTSSAGSQAKISAA